MEKAKEKILKIRLSVLIGTAFITVSGEFFCKFGLKNETAANAFLILGILALVAVDPFVQLLRGKQVEDVLEKLDQLEAHMGNVPDPKEIQKLHSLRTKPLHHYHLTKDTNGNESWYYRIITFDGNPGSPTLTATASYMPYAGAEKRDHQYHTEAFIERSHLIMKTSRSDGTSDIGIEVFTKFISQSTASFRLYGLMILITWWHDQPATSISILSDVPIVPGAVDGAQVANSDLLQSEWDTHSGIARLPALTGISGIIGTQISDILNKPKT